MTDLQRDQIEEYVVFHLDQAIAEGWIQPYFQPIIRTITGNLAAAEALARWVDPMYGCLMPAVFVPALEKHGLICKLDCFIFREVLKIQRRLLDAGQPVRPVTVNLSRQDFDRLDIKDFVLKSVKEFGVSRDLIYLEITESVLAQNTERMIGIVKDLRSAGFQIWMDDFGSGYSSLTFLNDYTLNCIKLDMNFLKSFTRTSMEIMRSTVKVAKRLGIRTLAEGVEKKEHVRFLREIGCDLMQGYYYGKPCAAQGMQNYIESLQGRTETISQTKFYNRADACVIDTDVPRAVLEYDMEEEHFHYLFVNQSQREQLQSFGRKTLEDSEFIINNHNSPMWEKIRDFVDREIRLRDTVTMYFLDNSSYARLTGRMVTRKDKKCILLASLVNITEDRLKHIDPGTSRFLKNVDLLFDDVHLFHPDNNTSLALITNMGIAEGLKPVDHLREGLAFYCRNYILPEDQDRYRVYADVDTMGSRLQAAPGHRLCDYFRTYTSRKKDAYSWKEYNLLLVPGSDDTRILSCIKEAAIVPEDRQIVIRELQKEDGVGQTKEIS